MALGRWLLKDTQDTTLIIDVGAETTQVHFYGGAKLIFSRNLNIGGEAATSAISTANGISFAEAEAKKVKVIIRRIG
ncbi:MAG TPA: hypothetical protein DEA85_01105 [Firmicutes bacterium]|nr:hypothetical protein [Bacillota bacterium]